MVFTLTLAATAAHGQVIDKNANTGTISAEATPADMGKTQMIGEDPLKMNLKAVQEAFDTSDLTANVVTFKYDPKVTYKVRTRLGVRTLVTWDERETLYTYVVGNPTVFDVTGISKEEYKSGIIPNMLTVKPVFAGADTNLTIITKHQLTNEIKTYNFYLRADPVDSKTVPAFVVNVTNGSTMPKDIGTPAALVLPIVGKDQGAAPLTPLPTQTGLQESLLKEKVPFTVENDGKIDYLKSTENGDNYNFKYKAMGTGELAPAMVYDDGTFTYFDFRDRLPSDRLPVVFKVIDGYDTIVNTRMVKGFLIAESLSKEGWTLKNGKKHTCIKPTASVGVKQRQAKTEELVREYQQMTP